MANYFVSVILSPNSAVNRAFQWIAQSLQTALRGLGHDARIQHNGLSSVATNIVIGAHQLDTDQLRNLPPGSILYNLEDLGAVEPQAEYWRIVERHRVWDYSPRNIERWLAWGCVYPPLLVEIGYLPEMRAVLSSPKQEIDVLVFGLDGALDGGRGLAVLCQLQQAGLRVVATEAAHSDDCTIDPSRGNELIAHAKVVLNLHCQGLRLLQAVRTSFRLANSKAVVSEASPDIGQLYDGVAVVPCEGLAGVCIELIRNPAKRYRLESEGFQHIQGKDLRKTLAGALSNSGLGTGLERERELRQLYLDMVQRSILNLIYEDTDQLATLSAGFDKREFGCDWPAMAHSMIGNRRMANLREIAESVIAEGVPGDFIETGVWRGGACIMMRAVLKAYGDLERRVWVADSFCGLPEPNPGFALDAESTFHLSPELAIPLDQVQRNFARYGLLDDQVRFLRGWFSETLPTAPIGNLAILRLDGDLYESTMDALTHLYDKVSAGGFIIVDDFEVVPACKQAIVDFRERRGITDPIHAIDGTGIFWRKTAPVSVSETAKEVALEFSRPLAKPAAQLHETMAQ